MLKLVSLDASFTSPHGICGRNFGWLATVTLPTSSMACWRRFSAVISAGWQPWHYPPLPWPAGGDFLPRGPRQTAPWIPLRLPCKNSLLSIVLPLMENVNWCCGITVLLPGYVIWMRVWICLFEFPPWAVGHYWQWSVISLLGGWSVNLPLGRLVSKSLSWAVGQ